MENISHKHNYIAIMDDLLVHSKKENHLDRIAGPFESTYQTWFETLPKEMSVFQNRTDLHGKCVQG